MKNIVKISCLLICLLSLMPLSQAWGGLGFSDKNDSLWVHHYPDPVNVRNGNFFYPAQDLFLPCFVMPLEILRAYNHFQAINDGPFGKGWTFNYNTSLALSVLGHPLVIESDGYRNEYLPRANANKDPQQILIDKLVIIKKSLDKKSLGQQRSAAFYNKYRQKLENNPEYMELEKIVYFRRTEKPLTNLVNGLYSTTSRGGSELVVNKKGIVRYFPDGRRQYFSRQGRLVKVMDNSGNQLIIRHDQDGNVKQVQDSCGRSLSFVVKADLIRQVRDSYNRTVSYSYRNGYLTAVKDYQGKITEYSYDKKGRLSLIKSKRDKIAINYYKKFDRVREQKGPGKRISKFRYGKKSKMFWREVVDGLGKVERTEFYPGQRMVVKKDKRGQKTTIVMSASCGKPERITHPSGKVTTFKYHPKTGNVLKKVAAGGNIINYQYDPASKLVSRIEDQQRGTTHFVYNKQKQLTFVSYAKKNLLKKAIKLSYGKKGKIAKMVSGPEEISIAYNFFGKPTTITYKKDGKIKGIINTRYKPTGKIIKTSYRPQNPQLRRKMMAKIQQYMSIISPAGLKIG